MMQKMIPKYEKLEKIKSKRDTTCKICQKTIYKGQYTFNNSRDKIDICQDCMEREIQKHMKEKEENRSNIDGVILRRSQRKRQKPKRYR